MKDKWSNLTGFELATFSLMLTVPPFTLYYIYIYMHFVNYFLPTFNLVLVDDYTNAFILNPELYLVGPIQGETTETLMQVRNYWRNQRTPEKSLLVRWDAQTAKCKFK